VLEQEPQGVRVVCTVLVLRTIRKSSSVRPEDITSKESSFRSEYLRFRQRRQSRSWLARAGSQPLSVLVAGSLFRAPCSLLGLHTKYFSGSQPYGSGGERVVSISHGRAIHGKVATMPDATPAAAYNCLIRPVRMAHGHPRHSRWSVCRRTKGPDGCRSVSESSERRAVKRTPRSGLSCGLHSYYEATGLSNSPYGGTA
jgi:hypothetical protein